MKIVKKVFLFLLTLLLIAAVIWAGLKFIFPAEHPWRQWAAGLGVPYLLETTPTTATVAPTSLVVPPTATATAAVTSKPTQPPPPLMSVRASGRSYDQLEVDGFKLSPFGQMIGSRLTDRLYQPEFQPEVWRGLSGNFNSAAEVYAAASAENSPAYQKALELMLGMDLKNLAANAEAEKRLGSSLPWLKVLSPCGRKITEEDLRRLEKIDNLGDLEYQELKFRYHKKAWIFVIQEVTKEDWDAASEDFNGWHPHADENGIYRAPNYIENNRYFVGTIMPYQQEEPWIMVSPYHDPERLDNQVDGGILHDGLAIVLIVKDCRGGSAPSASQTLQTKSPQAGDYKNDLAVVVDPLPAETAKPEPSDAALPPPDNAPLPTPEPIAKPSATPAVEEGLGDANDAEPNDDAISDPFGG